MLINAVFAGMIAASDVLSRMVFDLMDQNKHPEKQSEKDAKTTGVLGNRDFGAISVVICCVILTFVGSGFQGSLYSSMGLVPLIVFCAAIGGLYEFVELYLASKGEPNRLQACIKRLVLSAVIRKLILALFAMLVIAAVVGYGLLSGELKA